MMLTERNDYWNGFTIATAAIPVRNCSREGVVGDTCMGILKISRDGATVADWHLPEFAERWRTEDDARRAAFEFGVGEIDSGCFVKDSLIISHTG
ncbi:hypothetical protein [Paraburkholderia azotifigens]|uniref:DUF1488 domain-containing protein n=1 Tax=Paraburkholderia azotifigens TaxID=2057004 RepID=A0ABU9R2X7_9BURK